MDWNLISLITSSKVRFKVLTTLNKNEFTPTELSNELDIHISAVSRTLSELIEKELIVCLTNDRKKFKYYKISEKGKNILKKINDETKVSLD